MADLNELNTHSEESGESQEYIDKMVEKAEGASKVEEEFVEEEAVEEVVEEEVVEEEEAPDWLPEKFKTPQDLAKAYSELERKLGDSKGDSAEVSLDYETLSQEYWDNGQLSEQAYGSLEDAGIPKHIVDTYIAGQQAVLSNVQNTVFTTVGGEDQYQAMMAWAGENLSESEQTIFDRSVNTNNLDQTMYAVKGLHARYAAEAGVEPTLLQGSAPSTNTGAYASAAEVKRDMADRRYSTDPSFRERVARKLAKSNVF